ncbi:MAG: hypothetical protein WCA21_10455 [Terracidiphilus sp.]
MDPMNPRIALLLLCISLLPATQALARSKAILPDGCGDDSIQFDAKQEKDNPGLPALAEGKALIVFSESMPNEMKVQSTTRFGVDGAWAGATKGDSYFTVTVDPGDHNLCASMQSAPNRMKKTFTQMASFTAEAGKIYYFEAAVNVIGNMNMGIASFDFSQLAEKDGKYRIKAWKFATSKPKK